MQQLDAPPAGQLFASYHLDQMTGLPPAAVRVYYFGPTMTEQGLHDVVNRIRTEALIQRTVSYTSGRAIALRGPESQIAVAEQIVAQARP